MRPNYLNYLFADVTTINGVGPNIANYLEVITGTRLVKELLWHLPSSVLDRTNAPKINQIKDGDLVTITGHVSHHLIPKHKKQPYKIKFYDETGELYLVFFRGNHSYLNRILPINEMRIVSGKATIYEDSIQINHPDIIGNISEKENILSHDVIYPLTSGLKKRSIKRAIEETLGSLPTLKEWIDPVTIKKTGWCSWKDSILAIHSPQSIEDLSPDSIYRNRIAYDELLASQIALQIHRKKMKENPGRIINGNSVIRDQVISSLHYTLTDSQKLAIDEILTDMKKPNRMLRILQGDVGSGKTIVAFMAMLACVEDKTQAALMVPTEILAIQHYETLNRLSENIGVRILLLTGKDKGKEKQNKIYKIKNHLVDIIIGTHALFQEGVNFKNLSLTVIDEQHKFGVHQRFSLSSRSEGIPPDILVMSATPIPRSLSLTVYGDVDLSKLNEKPRGRSPITTRVMSSKKIKEITERLKIAINKGERIYWVCPLVYESENVDAAAAESRYEELKKIFGKKVGLIHGKMKSTSRQDIMSKFAQGHISILVSTTVIEVGVDVPDATIIVIEQAERFGLAQLHQLRGRVGRSTKKSNCLLLYSSPLSNTAKSRLGIMRKTEDGFIIANEDLKLRGSGEIFGVRQSGLPEFKTVDIILHSHLIPIAHEEAKKTISNDPKLESSRGKALRNLLYLYDMDTSINIIGG